MSERKILQNIIEIVVDSELESTPLEGYHAIVRILKSENLVSNELKPLQKESYLEGRHWNRGGGLNK